MSSTKKSSPWSPKELLVIVILLALAFVVLQAYIAAGAHAFPNSYKLGGFTVTLGSYMLDVGSTKFPLGRHVTFLRYWSLLGSLFIVLLSTALFLLLRRKEELVDRIHASVEKERPHDRWFIAGATLFLFFLSLGVKYFVLQGVHLTDDETAYEFTSKLLTQFKLYIESPPMKLFFDRRFVINDGKMYSQYFIGWPLLLAPGYLIKGLDYVMNSLYAALTLPALYGVAWRIFQSRFWARCTLVLYISSPFLLVLSATKTSHTTCILALTWTFLFFLKMKEQKERVLWHALIGFTFCVAFFIRPSSALGIGAPVLIVYTWLVFKHKLFRNFLAFVIPCVVMAGLFLGVNKVQTGKAFLPAYNRVIQYNMEKGARFSGSNLETLKTRKVHNFDFNNLDYSIAQFGAFLIRMENSFWGWPIFLPLILLGVFAPRMGLFAASVATYFSLHFFLSDIGVPTFGPMHSAEMLLPFLLLSVAAFLKMHTWLKSIATRLLDAQLNTLAALPVVLFVLLVTASWIGYVPYRFQTIVRVSDAILTTPKLIKKKKIRKAVVFVARPYAPRCKSYPSKHFIFSHPINDPKFNNDILFVNHLGLENNKRLMKYFPKRKGYALQHYQGCKKDLIPLDKLDPKRQHKPLTYGYPPLAGKIKRDKLDYFKRIRK